MAFDRNCPLGDGCVGVEGFSICDCGSYGCYGFSGVVVAVVIEVL